MRMHIHMYVYICIDTHTCRAREAEMLERVQIPYACIPVCMYLWKKGCNYTVDDLGYFP